MTCRVALPGGRPEVGTGELAIGQVNAQLANLAHHLGQEIVAHLVPESPGTGVDEDGDLPHLQPEGPGHRCVVYLLHHPHLQEVIAGAQGAQLFLAPLEGPVADHLGVSPGQASAVLGVLQVIVRAVSLPHRPPRPLPQHPLLFGPPEAELARGPHAGGHVAEEHGQQLLQAGPHLRGLQPRDQQPAPAVDVVAHPSGGDHTLGHVEGGHPPDGEPITPVNVRHGQRVSQDARQVGHVRTLL